MFKKSAKVMVFYAAAFLAGTAGFQPGGQAIAQEGASAEKRLERVEKQLRAVQRKVFGSDGLPVGTAIEPVATGKSSSRKLVADMSVKISAVERQMREITGRLETIEYTQEQLMKKFELLSKDTSIRFEEMRSAAVMPATEAASPKAAPVKAPELALPEGNTEIQYQWAFDFVAKNDLKKGHKALTLFLKAHPTGQLSANAHFWLGRVNLQEGKFAQAAEQFLMVFEGYPKHKKAPESLSELGNAMIKLGENGSACEAFLEFRRAYPDALDRLKRRVAAGEIKAKC